MEIVPAYCIVAVFKPQSRYLYLSHVFNDPLPSSPPPSRIVTDNKSDQFTCALPWTDTTSISISPSGPISTTPPLYLSCLLPPQHTSFILLPVAQHSVPLALTASHPPLQHHQRSSSSHPITPSQHPTSIRRPEGLKSSLSLSLSHSRTLSFCRIEGVTWQFGSIHTYPHLSARVSVSVSGKEMVTKSSILNVFLRVENKTLNGFSIMHFSQ